MAGAFEALETAIFTQASKIQTSLPIWFPNRSGIGAQNAVPAGPHYRLDLLFAGVFNVGISETSQVRGVLQIRVMTEQDKGSLIAAREVDKILAAFPRGLKLSQDGYKVNFDREGIAGPSFPDDPWYSTPVSVPFNMIK